MLCVDDSRDLTDILGRCIAGETDMESAGSLSRADDLVAEVEKAHADIVLLDLTMPAKDPLEAMRELGRDGASDGGRGAGRSPEGGVVAGGAHEWARVIAFSGRSDQDAVDSAQQAGASGFVSKDARVPVILEAIREVARGVGGKRRFRVWL